MPLSTMPGLNSATSEYQTRRTAAARHGCRHVLGPRQAKKVEAKRRREMWQAARWAAQVLSQASARSALTQVHQVSVQVDERPAGLPAHRSDTKQESHRVLVYRAAPATADGRAAARHACALAGQVERDGRCMYDARQAMVTRSSSLCTGGKVGTTWQRRDLCVCIYPPYRVTLGLCVQQGSTTWEGPLLPHGSRPPPTCRPCHRRTPRLPRSQVGRGRRPR